MSQTVVSGQRLRPPPVIIRSPLNSLWHDHVVRVGLPITP